jgi:HlyD family secretion protein
VANQDLKLLPNVNVGVAIITAEHADVLTVPREALREDDSVPYVYAVAGNEIHRQNVQTSISNLTKVEITGGLAQGALVAIGSTNSKPLRDHLPVKVAQ